MTSDISPNSVVEMIRQSPPLDNRNIIDDSWVKNKTILITGGAGAFGQGFLRRWAAAGAVVIIGDINAKKGDQVVRELRKKTGNAHLHFVYCDVTNWSSQLHLFREALRLSPHGGIDTVVANAGIASKTDIFMELEDLETANPPPPDLAVLDVNITGVVYTSYLALYHLQRNPGSRPADPKCDPGKTHRDRHLLLMSSIAGLIPLPGVSLYGASKHAVLGLYRCLRASSFSHGVRVNIVCPNYMDTPLLSTMSRMLLAGTILGDPEDVVEAATRFAADPRVVGRAVAVGPKMKVVTTEDGEWKLSLPRNPSGPRNPSEPRVEKAIWEIYPQDFEEADVFQRRIIGLINMKVEKRGLTGVLVDVASALLYPLKSWWRS